MRLYPLCSTTPINSILESHSLHSPDQEQTQQQASNSALQFLAIGALCGQDHSNYRYCNGNYHFIRHAQIILHMCDSEEFHSLFFHSILHCFFSTDNHLPELATATNHQREEIMEQLRKEHPLHRSKNFMECSGMYIVIFFRTSFCQRHQIHVSRYAYRMVHQCRKQKTCVYTDSSSTMVIVVCKANLIKCLSSKKIQKHNTLEQETSDYAHFDGDSNRMQWTNWLSDRRSNFRSDKASRS